MLIIKHARDGDQSVSYKVFDGARSTVPSRSMP
jgi:hypothetical protein